MEEIKQEYTVEEAEKAINGIAELLDLDSFGKFGILFSLFGSEDQFLNALKKVANVTYNNTLEIFYNGLADELLWIKERFGDDVYTEVWCSVGCLKDKLKDRGYKFD